MRRERNVGVPEREVVRSGGACDLVDARHPRELHGAGEIAR